MKKTIRVSHAQINTIVGDIKGNFNKIVEYIEEAEKKRVDIISFPELTITGYPPEDLLLKPRFIDENLKMLSKVEKKVGEIIAVIGFVDRKNGKLYNSAAIIYNGKIYGIYHKFFLPNYSVFDERRYFTPGKTPLTFSFDNICFGVNICEDIWHQKGPYKKQSEKGASFIISINGSPYHFKKWKEREEIAKKQCIKNRTKLIYTNLVGGQDELVFDGQSFVMDENGKIISKAKSFEEGLFTLDIEVVESDSKNSIKIPKKIKDKKKKLKPVISKNSSDEEEIYLALKTGLYNYVIKNNFKKVVVGLSGGIDSSLVATIAVDTLGKENVKGVFMPSRYTSKESEEDAKQLAKNLGIELFIIPIDSIFSSYLETLKHVFKNLPSDITEENIQARIRGNILMALSNKFKYLVLTTGNKSEMSVGYATLYGDMAGGFAIIKDVYKTLVYKLAKYRNSLSKVIPERVIIKPPTAELKPGQKDQDTLPPYELLDKILKEYIENDKTYREIVGMGFDEEVVKKVVSMVDRNEYKRRQSPPGIKITPKAFGKDRRMPITNHFYF